jgi:carotenoid cleavage dioxygenase
MAPTIISDLAFEGPLPIELSGRLVGIGPALPGHPETAAADGMVHSVHLDAGKAISNRSRWIHTDAVARRLGLPLSPGPRSSGPDVIAGGIVVFGGSILAVGEGSLAYELTADLDTVRRVDLAGKARALAARPKLDAGTGDLHLLALEPDGEQAHVVVSAGAHTRMTRSIAGAPRSITDLAITRDHVMFATPGFVGISRRDLNRDVTWMATDVERPSLLHAHDGADTLVVHALTPSLERWTLDVRSETVQRTVLDPTPMRFGGRACEPGAIAPRHLWTTGDDTVFAHDLTTTTSIHCAPRGHVGDLAFVADPPRGADTDAGWLVGFVPDRSEDQTDVVVLDARDVARPAIATVRIPRRVPLGLHVTWIPSTHR